MTGAILALLYLKEELAVFNRLTVLDENLDDSPFRLSLNLIHDLHRLNDADERVFRDLGAFFNKRRTVGRRGMIEGAHHWRLDEGDVPLLLGLRRRSGWHGNPSRSRNSRGGRVKRSHTLRRKAQGYLDSGRLATDLEFKILLLNREFGKFRTPNEINDLFDLFDVQIGALVAFLKNCGVRAAPEGSRSKESENQRQFPFFEQFLTKIIQNPPRMPRFENSPDEANKE